MIDYHTPKNSPDIPAALLDLALLLAKAPYQSPLSTLEGLPDIWQRLDMPDQSPGAKAWIFLNGVITTAAASVLRQPRVHCALDYAELKQHCKWQCPQHRCYHSVWDCIPE